MKNSSHYAILLEMKRLEIQGIHDFRNIAQALSGELRIKILELLARGEQNLNEIARALSIPLSTATVNVQKLEDAGLLRVEFKPGVRGTQKICSLAYNGILLDFTDPKSKGEIVEEVHMPIGNFIHAHITSPCGICTKDRRLGKKDDITSFFLPERIDAQLIWFTTGTLEYQFPNSIDSEELIKAIEFSAELCSEVPGYDKNAESDITLWINNHELGTWHSPGDFGGIRGKLSPKWWSSRNTQFGLPVSWRIDNSGSYCNDVKMSSLSLKSLDLLSLPYISIHIGVKSDVGIQGGMNLFGKKFGNYPQDLIMKIHKDSAEI